MTSAVSRLLKDFGAPPAAPAKALRSRSDETEATVASPVAARIDIEALRAAAFEEGRRAAQAELEAWHAEDRQALEAAHAEALAALSDRHEEETASRTTATLAALVPETTRLLSEELATLLAPLVEAHVVDRAVEAFAAALATALGEGNAATITVSGPTALFERVADRREVAALSLVHRPADMLDLAVEIDGTAIETRLAGFRASLAEALA